MTGTVLIVDDSLTVRMNLLEAFHAGDFETVPCATAAEARTALETVAIDAVVLDVMLPDADGVEFLAELRKTITHRDKPVVLLSSEAEVNDRVRGLRVGADAYVGKPYNVGYLVAKTRELMRARQPDEVDAQTLLLIEDSLTYRMQLKAQLEANGYRVLTAVTGEEGLRIAADRRPSVIVVDGTLPGIDGATVIRRVRLDAALRDIPCLLLTVSTDRETELDVLDAGADAFVRKGEPVDVILAKLAIIGRQTAPAAAATTASLSGPKLVLAVDDSVTFLQEIGGSLRADGYEVALARTGEDALALLAEQDVDCIVLDLKMPGIGGLEACQRIKQSPSMRDIPLIMVTALEKPDATMEGLAAGADDYLHKSDDMDVLKARVRAQIRRRQFQDENRRQRDEVRTKAVQTAEADSTRELARTRQHLVEALEWKNHELESFSYSVAHDLRSPLQVIRGFSEILLDQHVDAPEDDDAHYLKLINDASQRMTELVAALLELAHAGRAELSTETVDLTRLAREVGAELERGEPGRTIDFTVEDGLEAYADPHLVRSLLANLLSNAWKFTRFTESARIDVGAQHHGTNVVYFVRDNGPGFAAADSDELFRPFVRVHVDPGIPGTGIGLTTVHRIVDRHGGRVWAVSEVGEGATFLFTLCPPRTSGRLPATIDIRSARNTDQASPVDTVGPG